MQFEPHACDPSCLDWKETNASLHSSREPRACNPSCLGWKETNASLHASREPRACNPSSRDWTRVARIQWIVTLQADFCSKNNNQLEQHVTRTHVCTSHAYIHAAYIYIDHTTRIGRDGRNRARFWDPTVLRRSRAWSSYVLRESGSAIICIHRRL